MTPQELWQWVHHSYGDELGLTSSDEDYMSPTAEDEAHFQATLLQEEEKLGTGTVTNEGISNNASAPQLTMHITKVSGMQHPKWY